MRREKCLLFPGKNVLGPEREDNEDFPNEIRLNPFFSFSIISTAPIVHGGPRGGHPESQQQQRQRVVVVDCRVVVVVVVVVAVLAQFGRDCDFFANV